MNITFITLSTFEKVGGIQTFNKNFMRALEENGVQWNAISLHDKSAETSGNIYCCNSSVIKLIVRLVKSRPNRSIIVWNHISLAILFPIVRPFIKNCKNVLLAYGTEVWVKNLPLRKRISFSFFDQIWAISNYTRERLISCRRIKPELIRILPCCIDSKATTGNLNPFSAEKFNVLTMLRLDVEPKLKSVYAVIDVIPTLLEKGIPIHFTVIGRGSGEDLVKNYAAKKNLENSVSFTGFVDDPRPYFEHCDVFSLMSDDEGFGIVYLEAMQYSKCCIAAKNCGSTDVVINGITGFSVQLGDSSSLEETLLKLATEPDQRIRLGKQGRLHYENNFTFASFKRRQRHLMELLGSHVLPQLNGMQ